MGRMKECHQERVNKYFDWLCDKAGVGYNKFTGKSYLLLADALFRIPFTWDIPTDENRAMDGVYLRTLFVLDYGWDELECIGECSMLEMMIALADRLEFQTDVRLIEWFFVLCGHVRFIEFDDKNFDKRAVDLICKKVCNHEYRADGYGGFFPLKCSTGFDKSGTKMEQNGTELWYQMMKYLESGL